MSEPKAGMLCPVCKVGLVMTERQGVEIDYCQQCRGVWLDRGELDKILERTAAALSGPSSAPAQQQRAEPQQQHAERRRDRDDDDDDRYERGHKGYGDHRRRRRGSILDDIFDFG